MGFRELHRYEFSCEGIHPDGRQCWVTTTVEGYHPVDAERRLDSWIRSPQGLLCHATHQNDPRGGIDERFRSRQGS